MVDPVNLNIPGFPYLLFAVVFCTVAVLIAGVLSPLELAIRRHHSRSEDDSEDSFSIGTDLLFGSRDPTPMTLYECRHCGRTVEPRIEHCPDCGAPASAIARYDIT
jgi:ribosomal protein L37E